MENSKEIDKVINEYEKEEKKRIDKGRKRLLGELAKVKKEKQGEIDYIPCEIRVLKDGSVKIWI